MRRPVAPVLLLLLASGAAEHAAHGPTPPRAATLRFAPPLAGAGGALLELFGGGKEALTITPAVARHATLSWGEGAQWQPAARRLGAGLPLRVWVLGASPSCGHHDAASPSGGPPEETPMGLAHTFASVLLAGLRALYPAANHSVVTECHGGASSDRWTQDVAAWRAEGAGPFLRGSEADLVVVEAGLTDGGQPALVHRVTEILLRQLFAAEHRPAVLLLSTAGVRDDVSGWVEGERLGDAAHVHRSVARHYGVAQVSAPDAFSPVDTPLRAEWFARRLRSDTRGHPSLLGHDLIGGLLLHTVVSHVASAAWSFLPGEAEPAPRLPRLAHAAASEVAVFVRGRPKVLRLDEADSEQRGAAYWRTTSNWTLYADGRSPGLISRDVGAELTFSFPPGVVRTHFRYSTVVLTVLKTYEGVGTVRVRLRGGAWAGPEDAAGRCVADAALGELKADLQWQNHYSEPVAEEVRARAVAEGGCLDVEVSVVESAPPRLENKVKLYSLAIL